LFKKYQADARRKAGMKNPSREKEGSKSKSRRERNKKRVSVKTMTVHKIGHGGYHGLVSENVCNKAETTNIDP